MKKLSRFYPLLVLVPLITPLIAFAQYGQGTGGINLQAITPYSNGIIDIINQILVPVLIGIAFITFLWGIYKYFIAGASNESDKGDGRKFAMWGIIGFVIIISLWGIVNLVISVFPGFAGATNPQPPTFNTNGSSGGGNSGGFP